MGDPLSIAAIAAAVALAGSVQGLSGFGAGLVLVSTLPWFVDITVAVPIAAVFSYLTVLVVAWRHRSEVRFRYALPLVLGLFPGIPIGMAFLQGVNPVIATAALGAVLIAYSAWSLLRSADKSPHISPKWGPVFGVGGI